MDKFNIDWAPIAEVVGAIFQGATEPLEFMPAHE